MTRFVTFPQIVVFDPKSDGVTFLAGVDCRCIRCILTLNALVRCFSADPSDPIGTFHRYRPEIELITEKLIRAERVSGDVLLISEEDVREVIGERTATRLDVSYAVNEFGFGWISNSD